MVIPGKEKQNEVDLIKEFIKITDRKPEVNQVEPEVIEIQEKPKVNQDDFDYTKINDIGNDTVSEPVKTEIEEEVIEIVPFEVYKTEALGLISFVSTLSVLFLPTLLRRKLLTKEEYIIAKRLRKKLKKDGNAETSFTEEEFTIYEKLLELDEYEENVALTDKEMELIAQPLAEVNQKYKKRITPETRLAGAIFTVFVPKTLQFIRRG